MSVIIKFKSVLSNDLIQVKSNDSEHILISIDDVDFCKMSVVLDLDTAIKFSKEVRKQIGISKKLKSNSNG